MAITIPFDIRDRDVDDKEGVKTMVTLLGIVQSKHLSLVLLIISLGFAFFNHSMEIVSGTYLSSYLAMCAVAAILIYHTDTDRSESYYSGAIDGVMLLLVVFYFIIGALF